MNPRPLGYATVEEFEQHLDVSLSDADKTAAELYLRTAEEVVAFHTGGREFLPLRPALKTALETDTLTVSLKTGADRLPDGGLLYIDSEVIQYGGATQYPDHTDFTVLSRAYGGTTAATHAVDTSVYLIRGFVGDGRPLYPGDFLHLQAVWAGWPTWNSMSMTYMIPEPQNSVPYQWIDYGDGFSPGSKLWVAAIWGYAWAVPYGIKQATLRIAEEVFRRRGQHWTIVSSVQMENVATRFREATVLPQDVQQLLRTFRRVSL